MTPALAARPALLSARRRAGGFTIIELLVVVSIIAVLAGLVAAVAKLTLEDSRKVTCQSNMRQIGVAMVTFASQPQNSLRYPQLAWPMNEGYWLEQIQGYIQQNWEITYCPSDAKPFPMANAKYWPMMLTNDTRPWFDPTVKYFRTLPEWDVVQLSYRGSCDSHRSGGYGPKLHEYVNPGRSMALNEAWDNVQYGARQCGRGQDIWKGYPDNIDWERNWNGLTRHSGGTNWSFIDGSVKWLDAYSSPTRVSFVPSGSLPGSLNVTK